MDRLFITIICQYSKILDGQFRWVGVLKRALICHSPLLTLYMLGNFFKYFFLSKDAKQECFLPNILLIYNQNVKLFGSQMKPHILWGFIWIQIVCIGHQWFSKFTASGQRVKHETTSMLAYMTVKPGFVSSIPLWTMSLGWDFKPRSHISMLYNGHVKELESSFEKE